MMCSGPFSGAQDTPVRSHVQREGATWIGSVAKWRLEAIIPNNGFVCSIIKVLFKVIHLGLGLGAGCSWVQSYTFGAGAGGWVLLGSTGLVLSGPAQDPARLVYGSAALVASLRGQQSHFATLPMKIHAAGH